MRLDSGLARFRTAFSFGFSALVAATRSGAKVTRNQGCILYSASDGNRGQRGVDGFYSPILDPIQAYYHGRSCEAVNLSYPLSCYDGREIKSDAILLNRPALWIIVLWAIERLTLGKKRAARRKSDRRIALLRRMIEVLQPKFIIAFQATAELCQAAHGLNIAVIEPMHGMQLSLNDQIFRATIVGVERNALPDAYLVYDDRTAETIRILVGNQNIEIVRLPHPAHIAAHQTTGTLKSTTASSKPDVVKILVTMQWGYDGERASLANIIPNGILHPSLEQAIADNPDVMWCLRMHPVQLRYRRYRRHRGYVEALARRFPNVEWKSATERSLADMLAIVHGHITMTSGSVGEAAIFGVPSLLLCPTLKPQGAHSGWFVELTDGGLVEFGDLDSSYISNWVQGIAVRNPTKRKNWKIEEQKFFLALDQVLESYGSD